MPYIKQAERKKCAPIIDAFKGILLLGCNDGELNYIITSICHFYLKNKDKERYTYYNEVIGVLECAKLELYRQSIAPYENIKIVENGDIK